MAATTMEPIFTNESLNSLAEKKVLVVGAGGIGCELLKNLVLSGFKNIDIIDLDTIELSNLNRQFLFQRQHVGRPKAVVAKESVQRFNPEASLTAYHDSITNPEYGVDYFKQFDLVMNALDNRAARNHVNRMCLASDVPLVESGSAGYLGQVDVIKKGETECYECHPKPTAKTYPGCTIRNTPSEPIHCIVWAKHLFNQLFGAADADDEVSPDTEDPEASGEPGTSRIHDHSNKDLRDEGAATGGVNRTSTKEWAMGTGYDSDKIIKKLFHDDIKYLLSMDNLWKSRTPPKPLDINLTPSPTESEGATSTHNNDKISEGSALPDQSVWSVAQCVDKFRSSITQLKKELEGLGTGAELCWDKDNSPCMDFTTSAANIRCSIFTIQQKSKFDVKSMAGNIIPAIATTNAVIAGLIVMEAFKILTGNFHKCQTTYLTRRPNSKKMLLARGKLVTPNPACYVCSLKPEVCVTLDTNATTVQIFEEKVLKGLLNMVAPDVEIDDGKGTILISSEEGETEDNNDKPLSEFNIRNGTRLKADDFLQNYNLVINIQHLDRVESDRENDRMFEVTGERSEPKPLDTAKTAQSNGNMSADAQPSTSHQHETGINEIKDDDDDDDIKIIEDEETECVEAGAGDAGPLPSTESTTASRRKRKADGEPVSAKKQKLSDVDKDNDSAMADSTDDLMVVSS